MIAIQNVHTVSEGTKNILISNGKITSISSTEKKYDPANTLRLHFDNVLAFPGLVNSHDHLEFNLFPQLGHNIYQNYTEWGPDIHHRDKEIIQAVLQVPKELRALWGIYKNLLNGITTIVQHGEHFSIPKSPINILQDCFSLHSVRLEKHWKRTLNKPFAHTLPYVIHIGEGTNDDAFKEIDELIRWNIFKRPLVGIHGIAMNSKQAESFKALVWCPDSNFFLCNATARVNELKTKTKILFGSDSTLSAGWSIWEHLRLARNTGMLTDMELFESFTITPASVWDLSETGCLAENKNADIVVAKMKSNENKWDNFFSLKPEDILLVICKGTVVLFDETLLDQVSHLKSTGEYSKVFIKNTCKFVKGDLPGLARQIRQYNPAIKFPVEID